LYRLNTELDNAVLTGDADSTISLGLPGCGLRVAGYMATPRSDPGEKARSSYSSLPAHRLCAGSDINIGSTCAGCGGHALGESMRRWRLA